MKTVLLLLTACLPLKLWPPAEPEPAVVADASREAFGRMQEIYLENGAPGLLRTEFFEGGHHCGLREQQLILDFFSNLYYDKPY